VVLKEVQGVLRLVKYQNSAEVEHLQKKLLKKLQKLELKHRKLVQKLQRLAQKLQKHSLK
jgi:prefoldin subunit 5